MWMRWRFAIKAFHVHVACTVDASYDISSPAGFIHGSKHGANNQHSEVSQVISDFRINKLG